jgi:chaperonin GroES
MEMNTMAIRPLDDRIVVKPVEAENQSAGGILLPDSAKEKPQRAIVVAVGQGARNDEGTRLALTVKVGDEILYGRYAGNEIKWNGEEYKILRESEVLALITR